MAEKLKVYNLPQKTKDGIKIYGFSSPALNLPDDAAILFDHLEDMDAICGVEGDGTVVKIPADTPLIYDDGKYSIDKEVSDG